MKLKSSKYWKNRFAHLENESYKDGVKYFNHINEAYTKAIEEIEKEISAWYMRYATENGITYSEAKKLLNTRELEAFRMSVEEYIKLGKKTPFAKELEQASVKFHVTRLEAIKMQMQMQADALSSFVFDTIDKMARKVYTEQYYKTLFTVQQGFGIGFEVMQLNDKKINEVLKKPWASDGKNFSDRIWEDRTKLVNTLDTTFTQGIIRGKNPQKIIKEVAHRMNVSKSNAARLVLTENKYLQSKAQQKGFKELGVKQFQISATLDSRTSEICQEMDGKIFKMSEYEIGVTVPPFHPYCRTHTVPYDETDEFFDFERAARDENGKYITVPADMTYKEWKEKFLKTT